MNDEQRLTEYAVPPDGDGIRLDRWLGEHVPGMSRRVAQALIQAGDITVDGRRIKKNYPLAAGQRIRLPDSTEDRVWTALPQCDFSLAVVFEDPLFCVVNKPSGIPTVPLAASEPNTLAGAIAARYPECARLGRSNGDSGLLQRLDTETSGLLIAARTEDAFFRMLAFQENNQIEKTYLALVQGNPQTPDTLAFPLGTDPKNRRRVVVLPDGNPAITCIEPENRRDPYQLLKVTILKGFRHQIRVHLAHIGFPIAGDPLYGGPAVPGLNRLFLHASGLRFLHPLTSETVSVTCPLPSDLAML